MKYLTAVLLWVAISSPAIEVPSIPAALIAATFKIKTTEVSKDRGQYHAWGSGFGIDLTSIGLYGNYILTAGHVAAGNNTILEVEITGLPHTGRAWIAAEVVVIDEELDMALLRVEFDLAGRRITMPREDTLVPGDPLIVIGCPSGTSPTATLGFLAEKAARQFDQEYPRQWTTSANAYFGNSGGPVIDAKTEQAIGILVAGTGAPNVSFFVPYTEIWKQIDKKQKKLAKREKADKADLEKANEKGKTAPAGDED